MTEYEIARQILIRVHRPCRICGEIKLYQSHVRPRTVTCFQGHQFSILTGTIAERSPTPLSKWLLAVPFVLAGGNVWQLSLTIGVGYKTAWRMAKAIRGAGPKEPIVGIGLGKRYRGPKTLEEAEIKSANSI